MATTGYAAAIDTNDLVMGYVPETAWGSTPATPTFQLIRLDSEGFSGSKSRTRPNEINSTGQASANITTKVESTGSLNFSVSAGTHNALLAAAVNGVWSTPVAMSASTFAISAASTSNRTCTLTDSGNGFVSAGVAPGQFLKVYGAGTATATCSFIGRVLTVAAGTLTFDCVSNAAIATALAAAFGAGTVKGSMLRNGTTVNTHSFEKKFSSALYLRYTGCYSTGGSLDVGVGDYLKGTLAFINKDETSATAPVAGATYPAAPTGTVIDSINGIGSVFRAIESGAAYVLPAVIGTGVQKIGIKWTKDGAAGQYGIGSSAALGVRGGKLNVTGSMSAYFSSFALYTQYTSENTGMLSFPALDGSALLTGTKGYVITFCNASLMNPKIVAGSANSDFVAEFDVEGNPDVSTTPALHGGLTMQVDYFA